ncbi:hypothetical protein KJA17_02070 [Patescibacteria group bacterium]|nr:hypothetical protein [Patescibacteria group bacterium]
MIITPFSAWGWLMLLLALMFFLAGFRKIPFRPPQVGLVTIWGKRIAVVKKEGWHLFAPFFPFFYGWTPIKVEKTNLDFVYPDIRTKAGEEEAETPRKGKKAKVKGKKEEKKPRAGGELLVNISLTYYPDYTSDKAGERLITFINSGAEPGVENIIRDLIAEDIREMGHDYDWEGVTFSTGELKRRLVKKLTGKDILEPSVEQELRTNGLPDVADLGIRISRFNVGRVKEQGELARAAEAYAKEQQERRGEKIESEFVQEQTKRFINLGMSAREAADTIQTERGKASKQVLSIHGVEGGGLISAGIASLLGKVGGKKSPPEKEETREESEEEKDRRLEQILKERRRRQK